MNETKKIEELTNRIEEKQHRIAQLAEEIHQCEEERTALVLLRSITEKKQYAPCLTTRILRASR